MHIEYKGVIIREWRDNDVEDLVEAANNKAVYDNLRDGFPNPYTRQDAINWIEFTREQNNPPTLFAIEYDNKAIGSMGLVLKDNIYCKNVEIGYFISQKYWGKGITTLAVKAVVNYIFENFDVVRIYAEPYADNIASQKVLKKVGFRHEATLKKYVIKNNEIKDSCIYAILREEWEKINH